MSRLFVFLAAFSALAGDIPLSEFAERRARVREVLQKDVLVLYGNTEKDTHGDRDGFFQSSNFYYLTGISDPGGALVLTQDQETLYLAKRDQKAEQWTGTRLSLEDPVQQITGIQDIRSFDSLSGDLKKLKSRKQADLKKLLAPLRMQKSAAELAIMQQAIQASIAAHRAAWSAIQPGKYEYQIANTMSSIYRDLGCQRNAYPPIVGSGPNATILHYSKNTRRMDAGEMVLMDVGAECDHYAADITRTVPVNGKFTDRQLELYNAVLAARNAVMAAAKPGVTIRELRQVALDSLNANRKNLGKYMIHGVSHHIGLDVHDLAENDVPLRPGAVITVEPGVYLPRENIGIRIEDMVLITETQAKVLTAELPVEADAIERAMQHKAP